MCSCHIRGDYANRIKTTTRHCCVCAYNTETKIKLLTISFNEHVRGTILVPTTYNTLCSAVQLTTVLDDLRTTQYSMPWSRLSTGK